MASGEDFGQVGGGDGYKYSGLLGKVNICHRK